MTRELWERYIRGEYERDIENDSLPEIGEGFVMPDSSGNNKGYFIRVFADDGHVPHFHVMNDDGFDCSICLYEPKYYSETKDKLTKDQISIVNYVMHRSCEYCYHVNKNTWVFACNAFFCGSFNERMSDNYKVDFFITNECPDYSGLEE